MQDDDALFEPLKKKLILAEKKTKALLEQHIQSKKEEEMDGKIDDLMTAYNIVDVGE